MNTSLLRSAPTGYNAVNAIVREDPMDVMTMRTSSSGYFTINSRDRYLTAQPGQTTPLTQDWNNFTLQRAQALVPAYAKRIQVSEVRFPWYIPNITQRNDTIDIIVEDGASTYNLPVAVPPGWYTPVSFLAAFNLAITAQYTGAGLLDVQAPVLAWDAQYQSFYFQDVSGITLPWGIAAPASAGGYMAGNMNPTVGYYNNPPLALTMGVPLGYLSSNSSTPNYLNTASGISTYFAPTTFTYTDYVDIASDQLMRFTDARDGGTNNLTSTSIICRIYLADEISVPANNPIGTAPYLIHRQFKTPKSIKWEPRSFVSFLDVKVYDQYGQLVPIATGLPTTSYYAGYPDFQITMLASED